MSGPDAKDLVVLVADKNMEHAVRGLLRRPGALGARPISFDLFVHPERDPGCLLKAHDFLRPFLRSHAHAFVMLDRHGSGREDRAREGLEAEIGGRLSSAGWRDRAAGLVLDPELEAWVWGESPHVDEVLGWQGRNPDLRGWLRERGFLDRREAKPPHPKEAMEAALRAVHVPRSSALYLRLAERVSLDRCVDPAFGRFRSILTGWFPG